MAYEKPLFFRVMAYARSADRDVIDMVSGDPDWGAPPALAAALHEYADGGGAEFQYPPSEGLTELREEIAERRGVDADAVIVTNGTAEANQLAMAGALERDAGDEIVMADPVYPYYAGRTALLGARARYVPTAADGRLSPVAVREVVSDATACIVVNTPNNPTGAVYDADTMAALVDIAEANDAILLSDEVYDHFDHAGRFTSALSFESTHRVVTGGFSKSMAITGFRVGYGVYPPSLLEGAKTRHMLVNIAGSRPAQYAVWRALRRTPPAYYRETRRILEDRIETFTEGLDAIGATYIEPDGAFYVMARLPGLDGTLEDVYTLIDEAGVAGMPGEVFGDRLADWFRFALVTPRADEAADRLRTYVG